MRFTLSEAEEYEARGIGLLAGASYVIGTLDDDLLRDVEQKDFPAMGWQREQSLLLIQGPNGKKVIRFGNLDGSGRYVRLKVPAKGVRFASLPLLRATSHDPLTFLREYLESPIRKARKVAKPISRVGLLIGDETKHYSALLSVKDGLLITTDTEPRKAGGGGMEQTIIETVSEGEAASVRSALRTLLASATVDHENKLNTNTQVSLQFSPP